MSDKEKWVLRPDQRVLKTPIGTVNQSTRSDVLGSIVRKWPELGEYIVLESELQKEQEEKPKAKVTTVTIGDGETVTMDKPKPAVEVKLKPRKTKK